MERERDKESEKKIMKYLLSQRKKKVSDGENNTYYYLRGKHKYELMYLI